MRRDIGRGIVGDGSAKDRYIDARQGAGNGIIHFLRCFHREEIDVIRDIQRGRAGDEDDLGLLSSEGASKRVAHATGGTIAEESDGVDGLAGGPCGDEDFHWGFVALKRLGLRLGFVAGAGLGHLWFGCFGLRCFWFWTDGRRGSAGGIRRWGGIFRRCFYFGKLGAQFFEFLFTVLNVFGGGDGAGGGVD